MKTVFEIASASGTRKLTVTDEIIRIGSSRNATVRIDQLPAHCLTARQTDGQLKVTNRLDHAIKVGGTRLKPGDTRKWPADARIGLTDDVSVTLRREQTFEQSGEAAEKKPQSTATQSILLGVILAAIAFIALALSSSDGNSADRRAHRDAALQCLSRGEFVSETQEDIANRRRVRALIQDGAVEECRGNHELAQAYYQRAKDYAQSKTMMEDDRYAPVYTFLST